MTYIGTIEFANFKPHNVIASEMELDVYLEEEDRVVKIRSYGSIEELRQIFDFEIPESNLYKIGKLEGRKCEIFENSEGTTFVKFAD